MSAPSTITSLTFADLLRYHRTVAGLTQEELAAQSGLSVDAISTLERGVRRTPRKDTVALLADALCLAPEDRAAFAATARRSSATLVATPPGVPASADLDGHADGVAALPHGVVSFLVADLDRSTMLHNDLGDGYAGVLGEVQAILRTAWAAHAGHELGAQGDRFFAVFGQPDDALAAAMEAQRALVAHPWPAGEPVRVCMGLHSGTALRTAGRYVGPEVHRAARIAAAGHGGQVLVSRALLDEVAKFGDPLPEGSQLRDLGMDRLHGLGQREHLYQLAPSDATGQFPPLRTMDLWPIVRGRLLAGAVLTFSLLALVGLLLPFVVPTFPHMLGVVAGLAALLLIVGGVAAQMRRPWRWRQWREMRRPWRWRQWREMRQPAVALTSGLLTLVVVLVTLFASVPRQVIALHQQSRYDFSYTYHKPTHVGGSVTIATPLPIHTLTPPILNGYLPDEVYHAVWNACVAQLPDLSLPDLEGWSADQCREVPTVANQEEDPVGARWTIFHIDPQAVWSDGQPLTAADFLFAFRLISDPSVNGMAWPCGCPSIYPPWSLMHLSKLDARTVRIDWSTPYGDYLYALARLTPLPLHVYASGQYAGVYDPATGAYNSALARKMVAQASFNLWLPVDNGPFIVRRVDGYSAPLPVYQSDVISTAQRLVLARNPRFFSNFFHTPALDQVTFETVWPWSPTPTPGPAQTTSGKMIAAYRQGGITVVDTLGPIDLAHLGGIPSGDVITNPIPQIITMGFNQRGVAPNARTNGGVSLFADLTMRKAFTEAFDRCGALKAVLGLRDCNDPNFHTDEHAARPSPDFDPGVTLPAYNPADARRLLDRAGYHVVGGLRRYRDGVTPLQFLISFSFGAIPYAGLARRLQQDYARNLNVAVQFEQPLGQLFGDTTVAGAFDIGMWRETVGPDPVENLGGWAWNSASIPSAKNPDGINFLGLIDPWIVAQDRLGTRTVDGAQRAAIYKGMARHATEQIDYLPLLIVADTALVKPTLCNFKKWPDLGSYLWNMADWYTAPKCS